MPVWLIEPHDPLIVRDARPFGPNPGAIARSLPFPFPSTIAGSVRTLAGSDDQGVFMYVGQQEQLQKLKSISIQGPLLVAITEDEQDTSELEFFVSMPHDALLLQNDKDENAFSLQRLLPLTLPKTYLSDEEKYSIIGPRTFQGQKPAKETPSFWRWSTFQQWLLDPTKLEGNDQLSATLGLPGLKRDLRMHVSIDADLGSAQEGMLFATSGLEFTHASSIKYQLHTAQRLALAVNVDFSDPDHTLHSGITSIGGERRLASWHHAQTYQFPSCPDALTEQISTQKGCRLHLLTPAFFQKGSEPTWLQADAQRSGVTITIQTMAGRRPDVVSGWDLDKGEPKPSRRLSPSGTVFFLYLDGDKEDIKAWIAATWMHCISDHEQDRRDGFGLAVLGTWNRETYTFA